MARGCIKADDCGAFLLKGEKGVTFTPNYDPETGMLSWSNNGGLENPPPVCIKGKDGVDGEDGDDYIVEITDEEIEDILDSAGDDTGSGDTGENLGDEYYEITDDEIDEILKS